MVEFTGNIEVSLPDLFTIANPQTDVAMATRALDQAAVTIETISGVMFDAVYRDNPVTGGDAAWLRKAAVFQAVWLLDHPESLSSMGVSSLSQDGVSVSASDGLTFVLAPLAKRALNNCSWTKHGTLRVAPALDHRVVTDPTVSDAHGGWVEL